MPKTIEICWDHMPPNDAARARGLSDAFARMQARARPGPALPKPNIGIFSSEAEALEQIVERLARGLRPRRIMLFGSRARGDHRPDSDFDILVVLDTARAVTDAYQVVYEPVRGLGLGVDVVPYGFETFADSIEDQNTIAATAAREGKLLFACPGSSAL